MDIFGFVFKIFTAMAYYKAYDIFFLRTQVRNTCLALCKRIRIQPHIQIQNVLFGRSCSFALHSIQCCFYAKSYT